MTKKILGRLLILLTIPAIGQVTPRPLPGGINGVVRIPDGLPLEGAVVTARTDCREMGMTLEEEAKTSADGSFYIPPFETGDCNRIRLFAKKTEDLWLETGPDVLSGEDNGTAPVVVIPSSSTTKITMGSRGGSISFRVWDKATDRFIGAWLYIRRMPVPSKEVESVLIATGRDGSPDTLLLAAGDYEVAVKRYSCEGEDYSALSPPRERFSVQAGQVTTKDIFVDVRLIKPAKSYANPRARPCKPQNESHSR